MLMELMLFILDDNLSAERNEGKITLQIKFVSIKNLYE